MSLSSFFHTDYSTQVLSTSEIIVRAKKEFGYADKSNSGPSVFLSFGTTTPNTSIESTIKYKFVRRAEKSHWESKIIFPTEQKKTCLGPLKGKKRS